MIFGWGKVTKKRVAPMFQKECSHCNTNHTWYLTVVKTWFTLFFVPIIPYENMYCIMCPSCGSYIKITKADFEQMKLEYQSKQAS
jgi:hypothetical protein